MRFDRNSTVKAALAIACMLWSLLPCRAEVIKALQIESAPQGAEVFLLQGSKETKIGTTPFSYNAEFHSEMSILRLAAKKPGYETQKVEIGATESRVLIKLSGRAFAAASKDLKDPALRKMQEELKPAINKIAPEALKSQKPFQVDLARAIEVQRIGDNVYLVVPIELLNGPRGFRHINSDNAESFLTEVWDQLGRSFVTPLAWAVQNMEGLKGICLDAEYSKMQSSFNVGVRQEARIQMECQGGMMPQSRWDACATRTLNGCIGGMVIKEVYNPCATRVPVAHMEYVPDPQVAFRKVNSKARYLVDKKLFPTVMPTEQLYSHIGAALMDNKGNVVAQHGSVPAALTGR